jgi:type I restriction enzyme M protein
MNEDEARAIARRMIPANTAPITLITLENYLAEAANLLRGSIDQAD